MGILLSVYNLTGCNVPVFCLAKRKNTESHVNQICALVNILEAPLPVWLQGSDFFEDK